MTERKLKMNTAFNPDRRRDEDRILAALAADADDAPGEVEAIRRTIADSFRYQSRLITAGTWVAMLALLALAIWSAVQFLRVPESDVRGAILWASLFVMATTQVTLMKVWAWINWNRNSVVREIKRLELRLVSQQLRDARTDV